jgi:hypothetical protein
MTDFMISSVLNQYEAFENEVRVIRKMDKLIQENDSLLNL